MSFQTCHVAYVILNESGRQKSGFVSVFNVDNSDTWLIMLDVFHVLG